MYFCGSFRLTFAANQLIKLYSVMPVATSPAYLRNALFFRSLETWQTMGRHYDLVDTVVTVVLYVIKRCQAGKCYLRWLDYIRNTNSCKISLTQMQAIRVPCSTAGGDRLYELIIPQTVTLSFIVMCCSTKYAASNRR